MKFVLAGGPCCGKTTLLKALEKEGYAVVQEAARQILAEEFAKNENFRSWNNLEEFQRKVLDRQIKLENQIDENKITFIDSGIPTGIAYLKVHGKNPFKKILEESKKANYDAVFLIEQLSNYENDSERKEDYETTSKIHKILEQTYESLKFKIIKIPAVPVEERVKLIKAHVDELL